MAYEPVESRDVLAAMVDLLRTSITPALSPVVGDATAGVHEGRAPDAPPADVLGVHPYAVVHADCGVAEQRLTRHEGALTLTWYITCVGGTVARALSAADRVRTALDGATVTTSDGQESGTIAPPPGYTAGVPRRDPGGADRTAGPPRFVVPLQYRASFSGQSVGS